MMTRILKLAAALLCGAACDAVALTLDATDGDITYTDMDAFAAAATVEKIGSHKATLDFGTEIPGFKGTIDIQAGTLAVGHVNHVGSPMKIIVARGATLDLSSSDRLGGNLYKAEIEIAGTGVNGVGAIYRAGDSANGINTLFGKVTLADDAAIGSGCQVGFNETKAQAVNLNGHTLTYLGSGTLYLPSVQFNDNGAAAPGHLVVSGGTVFLRDAAMAGGSAANTVTMKSGTTLKLRDLTTKIAWKLIGDGAFTLYTDAANDSLKNVWAGPVELKGGQLTLKSEVAGANLTVSGNIAGNGNTLAATFPGMVTLTGTNDCGRLTVVDGGKGAGNMQFVGGKLTYNGDLRFLAGTLRFADEEVLFNHTTSTALEMLGESFASVPRMIFDTGTKAMAPLLENGRPACKLYWGRNAGTCAFVEVKAGASVSNLTMAAGQNGGIGGYWQNGGSVYWPTGGNTYDAPGYAAGGYGGYLISGGDFVLDALGTASFGMNGYASVDVSGAGRVTLKSSSSIYLGCGNGSTDWRIRKGGSCTSESYLGFGGKGYENCPASVSFTVSGTDAKLSAVYLENWLAGPSSSAILNVNDGGCLETKYIYRAGSNVSDAEGFFVNLNGGRIRRMNGASAVEFDSNNHDGMPAYTVYENGFTFEVTDRVTNFRAPLVSPPANGKRIAAIALPTDAGFAKEVYLGAPKVRIAGAGQGATAFAEFDPATFKVTGVTVTSPGWGYADGTTMVTMESADRTKTYACAVTLADQPTTGKGFVKEGGERLDLYGVNTYLGPTEVKAGILGFENPDAAQGGLPAGSGIIVREGATLTFPAANVPVTVPFVEGVGRTSYGYVTVTDSIRVKAAEAFAGKCFDVNRQLTVGANVVVDILDPEVLTAYEEAGKAVVIKAGTASGTLKCDKVPELRFAGQPPTGKQCEWRLRRKGNTLVLGCRTGSVLIIR